MICELFVDGSLHGVIVSDHEITVGVNGHILGDIQATRVVIHGHVEGNIDADQVYIQSDGYLLGTVIANKLVVDPSAVFDGESHIKNSKAQR